MPDQDNLPAKSGERRLSQSTEQSGGLVARGLAAIRGGQHEPLSSHEADIDLLFREAIAAAQVHHQEWSRLAANPSLSEPASAVAERIAGLWQTLDRRARKGLAEARRWVHRAADPSLLVSEDVLTEKGRSKNWWRLAADQSLSEQASAVSKRIAELWRIVVTRGERAHIKYEELGRLAADPSLSGEASDTVRRIARHWRSIVTEGQIAEAAAEQSDVEVQVEFGDVYYEELNYIKAVKWWGKAAERGCGAAQYHLGCAYGAGEGVEKDYVRAHMWFDLSWNSALNVGPKTFFSPSADEQMDVMEKHLTPTQIADAKRLAREWMAHHAS